MTIAELSKRIEEKTLERAAYTKQTWGAPPHIAEAVEPKIAECNREIRELQRMMHAPMLGAPT